jgi:hypothetical protein
MVVWPIKMFGWKIRVLALVRYHTTVLVRGLRAEFYPRILRKYKGGVYGDVPRLYHLVRINFYDKLSGQSNWFDFRFGAFCFLYEAYAPSSTRWMSGQSKLDGRYVFLH